MKARFVVEFTVFAAVRVDVAPFVMGAAGGGITTLAYPGNGIPPSASSGDLDFGWGSQSPNVSVEQHLSVPRPTGRSWVVTYRDDVMNWTYSGEGTSRKATSSLTEGVPYDLEHQESAQTIVNTVRFNS